MRQFIAISPIALVALGAAALALPGCCAVFCRQAPPPAPARLHRDSPRDSIAFLVDAIRRHAVTDVYETLDPRFVKASGDYSLADFAAGFDYFEADFKADADRLGSATVSEPMVDQGITWVEVTEGTSSAHLGFVNNPTVRVITDDDFFPEITAKVARVSRIATIDGDSLVIGGPFPLSGQGQSVSGATVKRVEFFNNWLLYDIRNPRGIRIADVLKNESGALQHRKPSQ